jgi:hypothetical protein
LLTKEFQVTLDKREQGRLLAVVRDERNLANRTGQVVQRVISTLSAGFGGSPGGRQNGSPHQSIESLYLNDS